MGPIKGVHGVVGPYGVLSEGSQHRKVAILPAVLYPEYVSYCYYLLCHLVLKEAMNLDFPCLVFVIDNIYKRYRTTYSSPDDPGFCFILLDLLS